MTYHPSQQGSVFFYILFAVVMVAALTAVMVRNSSTSESTLTVQQTKMAAQEMLDYSNLIANTVQKLRLRGCQDNQYNMANNVWVRVDTTPNMAVGHNATAASGCNLFATNEGNILPIKFSNGGFNDTTLVSTQIQKGSSNIITLVMPGTGTSAGDLVYHVPHLAQATCKAINVILGIQTESDAIPTNTVTGGLNYYTGTYTTTDILNDSSGKLSGRTSYCTDNAGDYRFYTVLLAR